MEVAETPEQVRTRRKLNPAQTTGLCIIAIGLFVLAVLGYQQATIPKDEFAFGGAFPGGDPLVTVLGVPAGTTFEIQQYPFVHRGLRFSTFFGSTNWTEQTYTAPSFMPPFGEDLLLVQDREKIHFVTIVILPNPDIPGSDQPNYIRVPRWYTRGPASESFDLEEKLKGVSKFPVVLLEEGWVYPEQGRIELVGDLPGARDGWYRIPSRAFEPALGRDRSQFSLQIRPISEDAPPPVQVVYSMPQPKSDSSLSFLSDGITGNKVGFIDFRRAVVADQPTYPLATDYRGIGVSYDTGPIDLDIWTEDGAKPLTVRWLSRKVTVQGSEEAGWTRLWDQAKSGIGFWWQERPGIFQTSSRPWAPERSTPFFSVSFSSLRRPVEFNNMAIWDSQRRAKLATRN